MSAVGMLAALLDERVAQELILEDLIILDDDGKPLHAADMRSRLRLFLPFPISRRQAEMLIELDGRGLDEPAASAARGYLRAASAGPTADAIVAFWIALEALAGTAGRGVVARVKDSVRAAGVDPADVEPSIGRLWGLRADVVHKGLHDAPLLKEGFYPLEALTRLLLRDALGLVSEWQVQPGVDEGFNEPFRSDVRARRAAPEVHWLP